MFTTFQGSTTVEEELFDNKYPADRPLTHAQKLQNGGRRVPVIAHVEAAPWRHQWQHDGISAVVQQLPAGGGVQQSKAETGQCPGHQCRHGDVVTERVTGVVPLPPMAGLLCIPARTQQPKL